MKLIARILLLTLLANVLASCEKFPDSPPGSVEVYLPAAGQNPVLIPGTIKNYRAIKETRMLHVPVYVSRSGLDKQRAFSVKVSADNEAAQHFIEEEGLNAESTVIAPGEVFTMPENANIDEASSSFDVTFDAGKLEPFTGKQLLLAVRISDPSAYALNEELSTLFLLVDVNLVLVGAKTEVTSVYLKNSGAPFIASQRSSADPRRGVLADWTTSSSVKNFENGAYGGFDDYGGGGFMSMERYGTPEIPDGKIYQTMTLPAARYEMEVQFLDFSVQDPAYFAAAAGSTLPDAADIHTALGHTRFPGTKLVFEVTEEQEVSLGVVADLIQNFQYFRINKFRLYQYKNIFD